MVITKARSATIRVRKSRSLCDETGASWHLCSAYASERTAAWPQTHPPREPQPGKRCLKGELAGCGSGPRERRRLANAWSAENMSFSVDGLQTPVGEPVMVIDASQIDSYPGTIFQQPDKAPGEPLDGFAALDPATGKISRLKATAAQSSAVAVAACSPQRRGVPSVAPPAAAAVAQQASLHQGSEILRGLRLRPVAPVTAARRQDRSASA